MTRLQHGFAFAILVAVTACGGRPGSTESPRVGDARQTEETAPVTGGEGGRRQGVFVLKSTSGYEVIDNQLQGWSFRVSVAGNDVQPMDSNTDYPTFVVDGQVVTVQFARAPQFHSGTDDVQPAQLLAEHTRWEQEHIDKELAAAARHSGRLTLRTTLCGRVCGDWSILPASETSDIPPNHALSIALPHGVLVVASPQFPDGPNEEDIRNLLYRLAGTIDVQQGPFDLEQLSANARQECAACSRPGPKASRAQCEASFANIARIGGREPMATPEQFDNCMAAPASLVLCFANAADQAAVAECVQ